MDYSDSYLPKRSDDIYNEIESFEDYEFTQCVAYEMAIRNHEANRLITKLDKLKRLKKLASDKITARYGVTGFLTNYVVIMAPNNMVTNMLKSKLKKQFYIIYGYTQIKHEHADDAFCKSIENNEKHIKHAFYKELDRLNRKIQSPTSSIIKHNLLVPNTPRYYNHQSCEDGFIVSQGIYQGSNIHDISNIKQNFKRAGFDIGNSANMKINFALPKDELIAYVSHIKDTLDKSITNKLRLPIELFGDEVEDYLPSKNYPKKVTSKKIADIFYIYDYVTARLKYIKYENELIKKEYDEKIQFIKNNIDLTKREKKIQILSLQEEHSENKINTKIEDIFTENELLNSIKVKSSRAMDYYYAIKPYITKCKYVELITDSSAL